MASSDKRDTQSCERRSTSDEGMARANARQVAPSDTPIGSLSNELLIRIFGYAIPKVSNWIGTRLLAVFTILASHVCGRWRDLVLQTPSLWTLICFRTWKRLPLPIVSLYESRSRDLDLRLHVHLDSFDELSDAQIQCAQRLASRTSHLYISYMHTTPKALLQQFIGAPRLRWLSCGVFHLHHRNVEHMADNFPSLQHFELRDGCLGCVPHSRKLTSAELPNAPSDGEDLRTVLARCSRLHTLVLPDYTADLQSSEDAPWPAIEAESIRWLAVSVYCQRQRLARRRPDSDYHLAALAFRGLEYLELGCTVSAIILARLISTPLELSTTLHTLHLVETRCDEVMSFMLSMKRLRCVVLTDALSLDTWPTEPEAWPSLEKIEIRTFDPEEEDPSHLAEFTMRRQTLYKSFRTIVDAPQWCRTYPEAFRHCDETFMQPSLLRQRRR
ncbi:hypothetical protein K523DRAFT_410928 [Schizophyllum commune Tattone D]|nr:hypothetical protein K523DRAFT_410928 [Schizophyllum commune Tattone D]